MSHFQVIVPMSGFGERFRRVGCAVPKPLLEVEGEPIIAHVRALFPRESDILFICSQEHLRKREWKMKGILRKICPRGRVLAISPHNLGPVHAVLEARNEICPNAPAIVNYCDFACHWDWNRFKVFVAEAGCDGAIPSYRGFHPHSLGETRYAYVKESEGKVLSIQEKQPFTDKPTEEWASSGTYYFSSGALMLEAFHAAVEKGWRTGGEYYVSLVYRHLLSRGLSTLVYPLQHFMQWGTPEDLAEYRSWSDAFRRRTTLVPSIEKEPHVDAAVVPMAGLGKRFSDAGYTTPKPLIPVSGKPMAVQASTVLPSAARRAFVLRKDMPGLGPIIRGLRSAFPGSIVEVLPEPTEGQALTALVGLDALERVAGRVGTLVVGSCDNGASHDSMWLQDLLGDPEVDVVVWGVRGHAPAIRSPDQFGWIQEKGGAVAGVSVKRPLLDPARDPVVVGTFAFRRAVDFRRCVERLVARDGRVNGEFYMDSCIEDALGLGLRCRLLEVPSFVSWGTPDELRTFEYWQSCFHKWEGHPYRLEADPGVPREAVASLDAAFHEWDPGVPF